MVDRMSNLAVGIDLGGTSIKAGLVSRDDGLLSEHSCLTDASDGPAAVLDRIAALIVTCSAEAQLEGSIPVGIGSPGAVNLGRTTISSPPNFPDWKVVDVVSELHERIGQSVDVVVENDANVAALGSAKFGSGREFSSFIMVTLGTGVGGAIIYRGELFRGATGGAGEIGHLTIDYEGPLAKSGIQGAIEAYIGQRFLSRRARYVVLNRPESRIHNLLSDSSVKISPEGLYEAAVAGDSVAIEILAWAGHKLGVALGSAVNLLDIRKVVVGGGMSSAGDFVLGPARESMERFVTPALRDGIEIVRESLGNSAGVLGAAELAFRHAGQLVTNTPDGTP